MEQLKRILDTVTQQPKEDVRYADVLREVIAILHANLMALHGVKEDEVAILLIDKRQHLKFYRPSYLEKTGSIPMAYTRSFVTKALQTGKAMLDNRFSSTPHLGVFEEIKRNNPNFLPIQKIMCVPLVTSDRKVFGAVEVSRKGEQLEAAGPDWTADEMDTIVRQLASIADQFYRVYKLADTAE
ncbi:MAG TPA: GAF domain-containing protein [Acidobacteriota bacterium]|mgnify:FL=1|nr:GAF domain-containing protein [Acidobacteriota bacterium]